MIAVTRSLFARMSLRSAIGARTSRYSPTIFSRSRPVRRWRRMSRIACAWTASRRRRPSSVRADGGDLERCDAEELLERGLLDDDLGREAFLRLGGVLATPRMIAMTRSRFASATARPRRRCARSSAFWRSNCVRRTTTVRRWSRKWRKRSLSGRTRGCPSTIARKMIPNEDCSGVSGEELVQDDLRDGVALDVDDDRASPRGRTRRGSPRSPRAASRSRGAAMCSMSRALLTWNGISVTTIDSRSPFLFFSISALPRTWRMPRPVR